MCMCAAYVTYHLKCDVMCMCAAYVTYHLKCDVMCDVYRSYSMLGK